ncbi:MAG: hypothetical protein U9N52_00410 [Campylobacterota bacterium]|nr:hypothetical protein [Campylobacterota bacterium]
MKSPLPSCLQPLINTLITNDIRPVLVGGYLRDALMYNTTSKDIDIELYNVNSLDALTKLLAPFAKAHEVGKSFGVLLLKYKSYEIDFSLPRTENKSGSGHKGFKVTTHQNIAFNHAAIRRDFTMNAMGFDLINHELLDPFHGKKDIENKILSCVNPHTFIEDPLRLFRAIGFCARFELTCKDELIELCQNMYENDSLSSLPKERIFQELKKLLLRSQKPSIAFDLLKAMKSIGFFPELKLLSEHKKRYSETLTILDSCANTHFEDEKQKLQLLFVVLVSRFKNSSDVIRFVTSLTEEKKFLENILSLYKAYKEVPKFEINDATVYRLALHVKIEELASLVMFDTDMTLKNRVNTILKHAKRLHVSNKAPIALLQGRDLIALGIKPSQKFSELLELAFDAQLNGEFKTLKEAKKWLALKVSNYPLQ